MAAPKKTKAEKRAMRLEQGKSDVKEQRAAASRRRRNKRIINWSLIGIIVIIIIVIIIVSLPNNKGEFDSFAKCLTNAGATMYGTDWCHNCQEQKQMFSTSFAYIAYINCDQNPTACENQGVTGYPTWIINDERLIGKQEPHALAEATGCDLP